MSTTATSAVSLPTKAVISQFEANTTYAIFAVTDANKAHHVKAIKMVPSMAIVVDSAGDIIQISFPLAMSEMPTVKPAIDAITAAGMDPASAHPSGDFDAAGAAAAALTTAKAYTDAALLGQTMAWTKYTKTFTNLSAAALTNDIELFQLAAKEMIHAVLIKASTAFSGGTIATYTVSVGPTGTLAKYGIALDVKQATGATVFGMNLLPGIESFSGATSIRIAAISTIANLNAATAGSVDVWVLKSTLP